MALHHVILTIISVWFVLTSTHVTKDNSKSISRYARNIHGHQNALILQTARGYGKRAINMNYIGESMAENDDSNPVLRDSGLRRIPKGAGRFDLHTARGYGKRNTNNKRTRNSFLLELIALDDRVKKLSVQRNLQEDNRVLPD